VIDTLRHAVPTVTRFARSHMLAGLVSYGANLTKSRLTGVYTGRIRHGEKPGDLQSSERRKSSWLSI